jgi:hypothetical protein
MAPITIAAATAAINAHLTQSGILALRSLVL